jgi:UDP-N-acetylglucosamine 2-epimerase (non-hydrolysing)
LSDVPFHELTIRRPDHFLGAGSGSHAVQTCRVMTGFEPLVAELVLDVVVVVGDVNSTLATAKLRAPLAHVEAGLRSHDRFDARGDQPALVTDLMSDYLFALSADAAANLRAEGFRREQIHLVGNVMVDTLLANADRAAEGDADPGSACGQRAVRPW